jgi:hypothetical protein
MRKAHDVQLYQLSDSKYFVLRRYITDLQIPGLLANCINSYKFPDSGMYPLIVGCIHIVLLRITSN